MARRSKTVADALAHGHPCHSCGALCCRYVAAALDPPKERADRDLIRWYLAHTKVCVYIDRDGDWWVQVGTDCRNLGPDGSCRDYDHRPQLCREYGTDSCERADHDAENIAEFETVEEFERFFRANYRTEGDRVRRRHRRYVVPAS
ncbi:MAG TPA: YkgJ family cysteine cluster protein [bacterium]